MAAVTIRNLSDATHRALKARATLNRRSAEAEMRPFERVKLGSALADMSREIGLTKGDIEGMDLPHVKKPAEPMAF